MPITNEDQHEHEWVVFSTDITNAYLMVQCVDCGELGLVKDPSEQEWQTAFHAPGNPYQWRQHERVHEIGKARFHVVRASNEGVTCNCPRRPNESENRLYERFPAELGLPKAPLSEEERADLMGLCEAIDGSDICSHDFSFFVHTYQQVTGAEPTGVLRELANNIEQLDAMGMHFPPWVVARVLRDWSHAEGEQAQ